MSTLEILNADLKAAMVSKDENKKSICRIILGDFQTAEKSETRKIQDDNDLLINVLVNLQKAYTEFNKKTGSTDTYNIDYINSLLPSKYIKYSTEEMKVIVNQMVEDFIRDGKNVKMLIKDLKQREDADKFDTKEVAQYINTL